MANTKCDQPYEGFQEFWVGISILIYQPNEGLYASGYIKVIDLPTHIS
jgi:hypothetical protein